MVIEQTIEILPDHHLELTLPIELSVDKARMELVITPETKKQLQKVLLLVALIVLLILLKFPARKEHGHRLFKKNMQKVDTNVILRSVLNYNSELSSKAREIIDQNIVEVSVEVLCEVVYISAGYYKIDRKSISTELQRFFE